MRFSLYWRKYAAESHAEPRASIAINLSEPPGLTGHSHCLHGQAAAADEGGGLRPNGTTGNGCAPRVWKGEDALRYGGACGRSQRPFLPGDAGSFLERKQAAGPLWGHRSVGRGELTKLRSHLDDRPSLST